MLPKNSGSHYSRVLQGPVQINLCEMNLHHSPGCVPVYVGAPNIDDIAPRGSFINANNLTSNEIAAEIAKYTKDNNA
jgi:hypothetical protein